MAAREERSVEADAARGRSIRLLGWLSGLGVLVVPWVLGGILASVGGMVGPESWSPERTFGRLAGACLVVWLLWVAYGSVTIHGFRRGALVGGALALSALGLGYVLLRVLQP
ncbi:MAG: hypothetical protein R2731_08065 [Nocardioides sp.]